ncbi:bifunctional UDP-N-acetylglucosamine diphosphorylase/glucosamine-1-phosphate N-acetyltransferase GlmU [Corynebacterium pyruviciproducens]|uniref:Bifunctional protein GlmU n=1 Tax=Corynebacterium pyruviciproducens TaxID=598660 RepID=A0AAF0YSS5_9CORY|nr:bifunctional UDP-N-acetylglucosamine diphosphorylase/glucosamine-1-phosphate N-acetyltransferase GlmU [Corynebacterium pyruviciproducens]MDH4658903.1 bifunctional UDP-N-acetylglucosamine diphosphorylase/glucosamine-1-phosphate N-acetyltransferase GlmU [Corynebacterium pyruviciproducens]MDK6565802.1 bifunctional UDP-N-acetylglucosamine diphosphorylase/glucosamine-1-phosphate N-acetyltransferase GlmU [Corynebacterium pyruviciproducens]MDK7213751.1 bifunctional UDP-N-acetylglucosamine diphosphor
MSDIAVIILAAGQGTRMKSARPKMLHEVGGRSMLSHALHAAGGLKPAHLVTVIGHGRDMVEEAIKAIDIPTTTVVQEEQNGTGDAVRVGLTAIPAGFAGTVIVTTSDVPLLDTATLASLAEAHTSGATVVTTTATDPYGYGRIVRLSDGSVDRIVEEKDATDEERSINEVNSGVYAFDVALLRGAVDKLDTNNAQGELYLTDVVGQTTDAHAFHLDDALLVAGVNDRVQLASMNKEYNRRRREEVMRGGATLIDPDTTFIDADVTIGKDVTIYPGTQLRGTTSIADNCEIGPDTTLTNMTIDEGAHVVRTHGFDSHIGPGANVGPFTYIRPGTDLGKDAKLGGFTEAKKATIGEGSKVPHLTYIGDATVGKFSNIGASSVFVNYDGVNKHHTTVGDHVRTGSDTMFVAPVNVGDGVYSGAGTVIKEDVPAGALVVSGGKQRNIEGWVLAKRPGTPAAEAATRAGARKAEN